ncbi:MAG TPA: hypothetical protein VE080_01850 [Candidatus Aquicultoraceae bacterium]|jgi:uncharacterized membrane protein|nr:hypothetical protein [Candidatus Aquicultoraceae bacterium]
MNRWLATGLILAVAATAGCSRELVGGAAIGAGGAGAVYEYSNKKALDNLAEDYQSGKISRDEYLRRKKEIENRSLIY